MNRRLVRTIWAGAILLIGLFRNFAAAREPEFESLDFGYTMRGQPDYTHYSIDLEPVLILDSDNWFVRGEVSGSWIRTDSFNQFSSNLGWFILSGVAGALTGIHDRALFWLVNAPSLYLEKSLIASWHSRLYLGYRTELYLIPIRLNRDQEFRYGAAWFPEVGMSQRLGGFVIRIGAGQGRFVDFQSADRSLGWHVSAGVAIFNLPAHSR